MSENKNAEIHLSRKRPLSRGSYGAESEGESTTGSDNGDVGRGSCETKLMKRERNRQTAKLNRDRKKEEARELQDTVQYLKRKNQDLQNELNLQPRFLADEKRLVMSFERHFSSQVMSLLDTLRTRAGSDSGAFYVINAASHFFPIIYASPAFVELTGYALHEIIGQNCGFLSGLQTSRNERERLNLALQQGQDIAATLLNYRRDGSMFWNCLHLANLHSRVNGEEVPHLIVGLHSEVFTKRGLLVDSASTEKDDRADSGSSTHGQQSRPGSHYTGPNFNTPAGGGGGGGAGSGFASKAPNGASTAFNKLSTAAVDHSSLCFTPPVPGMGALELRRVSSDDDDHTILQEIITTHQRALSVGESAAQGPGNHSRISRGKGSLSAIASASVGRGVRTRAMLDQAASVVRKAPFVKFPALSVNTSPEAPEATGFYHPVTEPRFASAAVQSPRCNSVMSAITADGTDNEASSASPANVLHLNAHDVSYIDHAVQRCESTNSLASETAPLSSYFASASLANQQPSKSGAFTSLSSLTPKITPSRSLPGPFPGLQGLSSGTLRHLGVESFLTPPGKAGEVPMFQHPSAPPRRSGSAASNVSSSSGSSSVHEATSLRRNYFSALEEHLIAEGHSGDMRVMANDAPGPSAAAALGSPLLPVSPGSAFTPNANTPFQLVRRVSLGEDTEMMSGCRPPNRPSPATIALSAPSDNRDRRGATDETFRESLEQDFDQELASYMDPAHAHSQGTPVQQRTQYAACTTGGSGTLGNSTRSVATLPLANVSADDVWAAWESGTIVDPRRHSSSSSSSRNSTARLNSFNAALNAEGPVTPVNVPLAPVGCAPQKLGATTVAAAVAFGVLAQEVRW